MKRPYTKAANDYHKITSTNSSVIEVFDHFFKSVEMIRTEIANTAAIPYKKVEHRKRKVSLLLTVELDERILEKQS